MCSLILCTFGWQWKLKVLDEEQCKFLTILAIIHRTTFWATLVDYSTQGLLQHIAARNIWRDFWPCGSICRPITGYIAHLHCHKKCPNQPPPLPLELVNWLFTLVNNRKHLFVEYLPPLLWELVNKSLFLFVFILQSKYLWIVLFWLCNTE